MTMGKKHKIIRKIAKVIAARFVDADSTLRDELYEISDTYAELIDLNGAILLEHPKLFEAISGEGEITALSAQEHEALLGFICNGVMLDREWALCLYFRGFAECMEYLKSSGVIKQKYMDMNFIEIFGKYPSALMNML